MAAAGNGRSGTASAGRRLTTRKWLRRLHAVIGLVSCLNLLMLLASGFLLQHREGLRLDERFVGRTWLPGDYRVQDGPDGVRADIVVTDLHSGRLLGTTGVLLLDAVTLGWFVLLLSGLFLYGLGLRNGNGGS